MPKVEIKFKGTIKSIHSDAKKGGIERSLRMDVKSNQCHLIKELDNPIFLGQEVIICVISPQMQIAFPDKGKPDTGKVKVKKLQTKKPAQKKLAQKKKR